MILIDSLYINKSGGKILLEYFISKIVSEGKIDEYLFIFDFRFISNELNNINSNNYFRLEPTEKGRKNIYKILLKQNKINSVFCFNNIPPPISLLKIKVFIYFHNTLILDSHESNYSLGNRFLFFVKRFYIQLKLRNTYYILVQSKTIQKMVEQKLKHKFEKILVMPFFNEEFKIEDFPKKEVFLYVADGVPQKNFKFLFKVWENLAENHQIFPELILTINESEFPVLKHFIDRLISKGIKIKNLGICNHYDLMKVYKTSQYLIFPSLKESFGLPLIEAALMKCKIIAINLPYVNDVVEPSLTFDPFRSEDLENKIHLIFKKELVLSDSKVIINNSIDQIFKIIN
jgi:hypothetical protein